MKLPSALLDPAAYPHDVRNVSLVETHMSWIFLTGLYAYKVKKPVNFDFADFTKLDAREHFCRRELALNRQFASSLYLEVVPIYATTTGLTLHEGSSRPREDKVIDWAVKMHQFPTDRQCNHLLSANKLTPEHVYQFGLSLAQQHESLPVAEFISIRKAALENFSTLRKLKLSDSVQHTLDCQYQYTNRAFARLGSMLEKRATEGRYRRCHGDLHLANLIMLDNKIQAFDCLEFNEQLSTTDQWADVAFLFMDLSSRQRDDLAYSFVDGYLGRSADYSGALLLNLFASYRAMVRAKVTALRFQQSHNPELQTQLDTLLSWDYNRTTRSKGTVLLTNGLSGSGKSYWSKQLVSELGCIRIRSDLLRKSNAGLSVTADSASAVGSDLYHQSSSTNVYHGMADLAEALAQEGERVIIDAASLFRYQRDLIHERFSKADIQCATVTFSANKAVLRTRIRQRQKDGADPSEADESVLEWQLQNQDCIENEEGPSATFDTEKGSIYSLKRTVLDLWSKPS